MAITLERAISLAALAHEGQVDKANSPYILHALRVMQCQATTEARIVAVFHGVVQHCENWDFARLEKEGFSSEMITALKSVTERSGENLEDSVRRAAADPIGCTVKLAELRDNIGSRGSSETTEADVTELDNYQRALALL